MVPIVRSVELSDLFYPERFSIKQRLHGSPSTAADAQLKLDKTKAGEESPVSLLLHFFPTRPVKDKLKPKMQTQGIIDRDHVRG